MIQISKIFAAEAKFNKAYLLSKYLIDEAMTYGKINNL